mmetsp:Transcript_41069/g.106203  ORF Transcript_41069/g.106203 Transcript_41069/m.106203 type:complete len:206 (-) Transcript_41069:20-637(-)
MPGCSTWRGVSKRTSLTHAYLALQQRRHGSSPSRCPRSATEQGCSAPTTTSWSLMFHSLRHCALVGLSSGSWTRWPHQNIVGGLARRRATSTLSRGQKPAAARAPLPRLCVRKSSSGVWTRRSGALPCTWPCHSFLVARLVAGTRSALRLLRLPCSPMHWVASRPAWTQVVTWAGRRCGRLCCATFTSSCPVPRSTSGATIGARG